MRARWLVLVAVAPILATSSSRAAAEPLADAIVVHARAGLPDGLEVVAVHPPSALVRRHRDVERATVAIEWPRAPRPGRSSVRLRIGGRAAGFVSVTVAARVEVYTATRALPAGHLITAEDVVVARVVVAAGVRPAPVAVGTVTTAPLAADEVVVATAVTRPAPVARGAEVDVVIVAGVITIHARGALAASARPGEPAVVRIGATGRDLRGTLVDDHRVVVAQEIP